MAAQKVLIIDDSKLMRLQVREMLPGNMEIIEAVDGADGFEKIQQETPSLIIMDCFMPKMNGWQVVNKMLSYPELHKVPVVLMSGREEDVQENAGELFDHFEFLAKPFDKTKLITAIKTSLTKAKQRRTPTHSGVSDSAETTAMAANVALDATTLLQKLQSEVQDLRQQNADLRAEMKQMKQQMVQITKLVKQNLSHV
jgi:CheY-like chemotaxis protein